MMISIQNISKVYGDKKVLNIQNLEIPKGESFGLVGNNGAGKTTLFSLLLDLIQASSGEILIDGEKLKYNKKALIKCRQKVGIVFQNPDNQIFAPSVEEDVAFGPLNLKLPMDEVQNRVEEALKRVGMEGFEKKAPHHLSGGQKKRVAIAGILAMRPEIMILDEPTAGLDPQGAIKIMNLLSELNMEGITIVISTHDVDLVSKYVNKIFVMADGEIIDEGTPKEIFSNEDLIEKANLKLPIISELFKALNDENQINIENNDYPLTISEAKDKILELMKN